MIRSQIFHNKNIDCGLCLISSKTLILIIIYNFKNLNIIMYIYVSTCKFNEYAFYFFYNIHVGIDIIAPINEHGQLIIWMGYFKHHY